MTLECWVKRRKKHCWIKLSSWTLQNEIHGKNKRKTESLVSYPSKCLNLFYILSISFVADLHDFAFKTMTAYYSLYSNSSPAAYFYKHSPLYRQQNLKPEVSIAIGCEVCHDKSESNSQILFPGLVETFSTVRRACRTLLLPVDILITLSHLFSQTPRQLHCGG